MILSRCSRPWMSSCGAPGVWARLSLWAGVLYRTSLINEDFPEPLTPVTATNALSGRCTSIFLRLCCRAPMTETKEDEGNSKRDCNSRAVAEGISNPGCFLEFPDSIDRMRLLVGTGMASLLDRY